MRAARLSSSAFSFSSCAFMYFAVVVMLLCLAASLSDWLKSVFGNSE